MRGGKGEEKKREEGKDGGNRNLNVVPKRRKRDKRDTFRKNTNRRVKEEEDSGELRGEPQREEKRKQGVKMEKGK